MHTNIAVIIPAAGSGTRMGGDVPKPFLKIGGETVLTRTLRCFNHPDVVVQIILAISPECKEMAQQAVFNARLDVPVIFANGGSERMYSIANALKKVDSTAQIIAVHDAVRPFLSRELFLRLIEGCGRVGACIPALPVTDTIKIQDEAGFVVATPNRNLLRSVQTPQLFKRTLLQDAYRYAIENNYFSTDDAGIVEQFGAKVLLAEGDANNFKLTYVSDMERAEELIRKSKL